MELSQEMVRPIAERLFALGLDVRTVHKVLRGYASYNTIARWSKERNETQSNFRAA